MGSKPKKLRVTFIFFVLMAQLGGCFPTTGLEMPDSSDFDGGADADADGDSDSDVDGDSDTDADNDADADADGDADPGGFCPNFAEMETFVNPSTNGPESYADICGTNTDVVVASNRVVEVFLESSSDNINEVSGLIRFAERLTEDVFSSPEVMLGAASPGALISASISKPTGGADMGYLFEINLPQGIIDSNQYTSQPFIELSIWFEAVCDGFPNDRQVVTTTVPFNLCQKNATSMHWVGPDEECSVCLLI